MTRLGVFDPDLRREELFDEIVVREGLFDRELVDTGIVSPPAPPTFLDATAGIAEIFLSWTASPGATSYKVYRSLTSGFGYVLIQSGVLVTNFTDIAVVIGTPYFYVVTAVGPGGESGFSNEDTATPLAPPPVLFYANPRTPFEVAVMFDFATEELSIDAVLKAFPMKSYADVTAPPGITDLGSVISQVQKPRIVLVFSRNQAVFDINPGGGFAGLFATIYFVALQQIGPATLSVNALTEADLRIIVAGDP